MKNLLDIKLNETSEFVNDHFHIESKSMMVSIGQLGPVGPKLRFGPTRRTLWEHGVED